MEGLGEQKSVFLVGKKVLLIPFRLKDHHQRKAKSSLENCYAYLHFYCINFPTAQPEQTEDEAAVARWGHYMVLYAHLQRPHRLPPKPFPTNRLQVALASKMSA